MSWRDSTNPFADSPPAYSDNPATDDEEERPILVDTSAKPKRSIAGTFCSFVFIFPHLSLVFTPLFVIGFFASTLNKALSIQGPGCILYATSDKTKGFLLGHDQSCSFVIYGEVVIVLLAIGLLLAAVIKAFMGRWFSPLLICDFILLVLIFITSLAISIVLSIGYGITCESVIQFYDNTYSKCSEAPLPYSSPSFYFEHTFREAMVSAWMVCCIALVLIVVESLLACCGCLIRHSKKTTISVSAQNDFNDSRSSKY